LERLQLEVAWILLSHSPEHRNISMMRGVFQITLLAFVSQTRAEEVERLTNRAVQAGDAQRADLDGTTVAKIHRTEGSTHATEEVGHGPTPNATLNAILKEKWASNINAGPHSCTLEDKQAIMKMPSGHADDSWGALINNCAHQNLNLIFGINQDGVNQCLSQLIPKMTPKCSKCYSAMTEYDFLNCKGPCLFSWCSEACIKCNHGSNVIGCIGFVDPQPSVCGTASALSAQFFYRAINIPVITLMGVFVGSGIMFAVRRSRRKSAANAEPILLGYQHVY